MIFILIQLCGMHGERRVNAVKGLITFENIDLFHANVQFLYPIKTPENQSFPDKQHLSNIWSSIHEKVRQHWRWAEKSVAYKKRVYYEKSYSFFSWKLLLTYAK